MLLAEHFAAGDKLVVILGDNIATASIKFHVDNFRHQASGARVLLRRVEDPEFPAMRRNSE